MFSLGKRNVITISLLAGLYLIIQLLVSRGVLLPYDLQILGLVCVNIMLAVSLNLINGFTGQFSIGHAGFWNWSIRLRLFNCHSRYTIFACFGAGRPVFSSNWNLYRITYSQAQGRLFSYCYVRFGEIIRVVILNIPAVGGARGFSGISRETTLAQLTSL